MLHRMWKSEKLNQGKLFQTVAIMLSYERWRIKKNNRNYLKLSLRQSEQTEKNTKDAVHVWWRLFMIRISLKFTLRDFTTYSIRCLAELVSKVSFFFSYFCSRKQGCWEVKLFAAQTALPTLWAGLLVNPSLTPFSPPPPTSSSSWLLKLSSGWERKAITHKS